MGTETRIQWTDHTFNPWIGCMKRSPGCLNCYAMHNTFARAARVRGTELWGPNGARHVTSEGLWRLPHRWNAAAATQPRRARVFCASLADVFEEGRPELEGPRAALFELIESTPSLHWQLLTKRPEWVLPMVPARWRDHGFPGNVAVGTSIESQAWADERIPHLLRIPARIRFLSCEPLLGPVHLTQVMDGDDLLLFPMAGEFTCEGRNEPLPLKYGGIDWVIVGGESGRYARPFDLAWARLILRECRAARVPVFVKQIGTRPCTGDTFLGPLRHAQGGDPAEWPVDLRVRQEMPV